jgi:hypothetical protein
VLGLGVVVAAACEQFAQAFDEVHCGRRVSD